MRFVYEYRTPDNERHSGAICAANRDAAYAELKKRGVKPSRLAEASGFFNKLFGKGKRWLAIAILAALATALAVALGRARTPAAPQASTLDAVLDSSTRRQPIGDAAIIDKGIREGWSDVFALEGDRFLASFAIPGVPAAIRTTTEEKLKEALRSSDSPDGRAVLDRSSLEARQIRAIVEGMKQELREFIADGGTIKQYGRRLVQRQEEELGYYNRAKTEIESAKKSGKSETQIAELREERNAALRKMGIKLLVLPE